MEKPTRKEALIIAAFVLLIITAYLFRYVYFRIRCNPVRTGIYLSLIILWGFSLHHRLIHPQVRHLVVSIDIMMFSWFLFRAVRFTIMGFAAYDYTTARYLWYLYYLPMIFIPTLALLTAWSVGLSEKQRLPRKCNIFWFMAAALFLLVITNDWHQLVFRFPDNGLPWSDDDYSYSIIFYVIAAYRTVCDLAAIVILTLKNRRPDIRRLAIIPCIPYCILLAYWIAYCCHTYVTKVLFPDMTAFACVMYAFVIELCIRCGMIRSNNGYRELFRASSLDAQITDHDDLVCLSSAATEELNYEAIVKAKSHPHLIDETTLLKSKPIHFGHILWREDVSEITEVIAELEENCMNLAERNRLEEEKLKAEKTLLTLMEKNRAVDLVHQGTAGQLALIDNLIQKYDLETGNEKERRKLLAGAAVVGAYMKRYGNLLLISERSKVADMADLTRCFEESFVNLELMDVNCLCSLPKEGIIRTGDMLHIYHTFETALEDCLFDIRHVWIVGREEEKQYILKMELVSDIDLTQHASKADAYSFDSGSSSFTFRLAKGGADQ